MSIGEGVSASITEQIQGIGSNLVIIMPGSTQSSGVRTAQGSAVTLTYEDAQALTDLVAGAVHRRRLARVRFRRPGGLRQPEL